jgi:hypothetical protein
MDDGDPPAHARAPEPADLVRICGALNSAGARYVLIGGFAVIAHGGARFTKDIDLLIDDAPENVARVSQALRVLSDQASLEVRDTDVRDYVVVRIVDEIVVDLMGRACGLSYADAIDDAERREIDGTTIVIASPATLMRTKQTVRPQDALDRVFLAGLLHGR